MNQLSPVGRDIARRCRISSARRSMLREFELAQEDAVQRLAVIEQGAMSDGAHAAEMGRVGQDLTRMRRIMGADAVDEGLRRDMALTIGRIESELERLAEGRSIDPLDMIDVGERQTYREVFSLIYECSANRLAAKSLIDKIIQRLTA